MDRSGFFSSFKKTPKAVDVAVEPQEENGAPVINSDKATGEENQTFWNRKMTRRTMAGEELPKAAAAAIVAGKLIAGGGIVAGLSSCGGKDIGPNDDELDPPWPNPIPVDHVKAGRMAVYYGKMPTNTLDVQALRSFDQVVVAPPNMAAGKLSNAVGYAAIAAVNEAEVGLAAREPDNVIAQRIATLDKNIQAAGGYLEESPGKIQYDPLGPGSKVVDLRNPQAYQLMKQYIQSVGRDYNGVFIDIIDSMIILEGKHPDTYKGITARAISLMQEVARDLPAGKKFIVNGGLQEAVAGFPTLHAIGAIPRLTAFTVESQYYDGNNGQLSIRRPDDSFPWTAARLAAVCDGRSKAGYNSLELFGIEPVKNGRQEKSTCNAAQQYERWCTDPAVVPSGFNLTASLYSCENHTNTNGKDLQANAALSKTLCYQR